MPTEPNDALSPLDGRYRRQTEPLRNLFSEAGLMRARVRIEAAWLLHLSSFAGGVLRTPLSAQSRRWLEDLMRDAGSVDTAAIKAIELRTNHDVKAVEYWLRSQLEMRGADAAQLEWVHFACTSEDINNLAYAGMLRTARETVLRPALERISSALAEMAQRFASSAMLARTHGQPASPTTMGKELANFRARLDAQMRSLAEVSILGKLNGAVGNFNAHIAALPQVDWLASSETFVRSLGLEPNTMTTQIEPHDWIAQYCHALARIDTVLLDLVRDLWGYISLGYFRQRAIDGEVGSSTMPHKINPIDFENAEGNLGLANALLGHFAAKLPVSRWQRDLSDSTVLRSLGVALGHALLAYESILKGLGKLELDENAMRQDLDDSWEVLAEAVQSVLRAQGIEQGYERLKSFSRGRRIDRDALADFISQLPLHPAEKTRLLALTPRTYTGLAEVLARGKS